MRELGNWDDANNLQNISKAITFRDQVRHDSAFDGLRMVTIIDGKTLIFDQVK